MTKHKRSPSVAHAENVDRGAPPSQITQPAEFEGVDLGHWSMSEERAFMENLFVSRFNSFLLIFSLFVTAGFTNTFTQLRSLVFFAGGVVLLILWLSLYRAYVKYDRIIKLLSHLDHPIKQLNEILQSERSEIHRKLAAKFGYKASWTMGVITPVACITMLFMAGWAAEHGLFG